MHHELNIGTIITILVKNARIIVDITLYNVLCISPESSKRTEHILLLSDHAAAARCVYSRILESTNYSNINM